MPRWRGWAKRQREPQWCRWAEHRLRKMRLCQNHGEPQWRGCISRGWGCRTRDRESIDWYSAWISLRQARASFRDLLLYSRVGLRCPCGTVIVIVVQTGKIEIEASLWCPSAVLVMPVLDMPCDSRCRYRCARCCTRHRHAHHYALSYVLVAVPSIVLYRRVSSCIVVHTAVLAVVATLPSFEPLLRTSPGYRSLTVLL